MSKISDKVKDFFLEIELIWAVIPGYIKVFLYSVISSVVALYYVDQLTWQAVVGIVLVNLGLYQGPRALSAGVQKLK